MVSSAVPTHGNYHNYHGYTTLLRAHPCAKLTAFQRYRYHRPGGHDSRVALLPPELLANARVLDVGCNEGWVSCELGASFHNPLSSRTHADSQNRRGLLPQRNHGARNALWASTSTTRSYAWPGAAGAHSGATKPRPSPSPPNPRLPGHPPATPLAPIAIAHPVPSVNACLTNPHPNPHRQKPTTFLHPANTCSGLFRSLLAVIRTPVPRPTRTSPRARRFRITFPSAVPTG